MCGVIAALGKKAEGQVAKGLKVMAHRGIRSRQVGVAGGAMGHVRLPIVGTTEEYDQPVVRGRTTLAFVGEILDFRERSWGAECDVDLVADTWTGKRSRTQDGPEGFREYDGFWSIVAHEGMYGALRCSVDYLCQKPLYVRDDPSALAVASEPDAVACLGPTNLDPVYLSAVVKWGYCPETWRTPYVGVRRMLPGEVAVLRTTGVVGYRVQYRVVDFLAPLQLTPADLKTEIESAVRRRVMSSDVPVACLVSGGLDSAITYTLARRDGDVKAYHVYNDGDDATFVSPDAVGLGCDNVSLERGLDYMQEPIDLGSLTPQVALSDAVAQSGGEQVCLTGDGADELFGGYSRAARYDSQASDVWHELVGWHLPRLDRVMMRNRVEVRSPFLARRVAAAALALPRGQRIDKRILRDLFRNDLPLGVADRPKLALRTREVAEAREVRSKDLVEMFVRRYGVLQESFKGE